MLTGPGLAQHWELLGEGRGRVRGCTAQEILVLIFHPNPS